jgi:hypothetical protein
MLDAANSMSPLYDAEKFNLFSNGFARKLSNVEFSALMVCYIRDRTVYFLSTSMPSSPRIRTQLSDLFQVLKVGPFHQHYQTLSQRHHARGDITAALIALERGADRHPRWGCGYHAQSTMYVPSIPGHLFIASPSNLNTTHRLRPASGTALSAAAPRLVMP